MAVIVCCAFLWVVVVVGLCLSVSVFGFCCLCCCDCLGFDLGDSCVNSVGCVGSLVLLVCFAGLLVILVCWFLVIGLSFVCCGDAFAICFNFVGFGVLGSLCGCVWIGVCVLLCVDTVFFALWLLSCWVFF